jgi:dTMP kinase
MDLLGLTDAEMDAMTEAADDLEAERIEAEKKAAAEAAARAAAAAEAAAEAQAQAEARAEAEAQAAAQDLQGNGSEAVAAGDVPDVAPQGDEPPRAGTGTEA